AAAPVAESVAESFLRGRANSEKGRQIGRTDYKSGKQSLSFREAHLAESFLRGRANSEKGRPICRGERSLFTDYKSGKQSLSFREAHLAESITESFLRGRANSEKGRPIGRTDYKSGKQSLSFREAHRRIAKTTRHPAKSKMTRWRNLLRNRLRVRQASIGARLRKKPSQRTAEFTSRVKIQKPDQPSGFLIGPYARECYRPA